MHCNCECSQQAKSEMLQLNASTTTMISSTGVVGCAMIATRTQDGVCSRRAHTHDFTRINTCPLPNAARCTWTTPLNRNDKTNYSSRPNYFIYFLRPEAYAQCSTMMAALQHEVLPRKHNGSRSEMEATEAKEMAQPTSKMINLIGFLTPLGPER